MSPLQRPLALLLLSASITACGGGSGEVAEPGDSLATELSMELAAWGAAFDAAMESRGDHVADGPEQAITVLQALATQAEAARKQLEPGGRAAVALPDTRVRVELPSVERVGPAFRAGASKALELAEVEPAAALEGVEASLAELKLAWDALAQAPPTVEEVVPGWGEEPAVFQRNLGAERLDRQYAVLADFQRGRIAELRQARVATLELEERLETLSADIDAAADALVGAGSAAPEALAAARAEYAAATASGDVEALAKAANSAANALLSKEQAAAVWAANVTLFEGYGRELQAAIDARPATRTIPGLRVLYPREPVEIEAPVKLSPLAWTRRPTGAKTGPKTSAGSLEAAQDHWRDLTSAAARALAAFELTDAQLEVRDPFVDAARAEIERIRPSLDEARGRVTQLLASASEARSQLDEARAVYRRAVHAERAYGAWQRASAASSQSGD